MTINCTHIATSMALLLLVTSVVSALEEETDVVLWTNVIPDAAHRARDLPILLSQVADPTVGVDNGMVIRLALAMAQDGDKGVDGVIHQGSMSMYSLVDAVSPTGLSRQEQAVATIIQAWSKKTGDAWLITWQTLRGKLLVPAPDAIAAFPANLALASPPIRRNCLDDRGNWAGWGSPALTAFLLHVLDVPAEEYSDHDLRGQVLRRLYESDSVSGRNRILTAIKHNDETIRVSALLLLPDESLPELDEEFRQALRAVSWNAICCASRYGSPAILEDIRTLYQSSVGRWACDLANSMLRYVIKHDRAAGLQLMREAMTMRDQTGCYLNLLPEVLPLFPGEDVNRLIDEFLMDPNEDVAREAIRATSLLPGAPARFQSMLDRFGTKMTEMIRKDLEMRLGKK